MVKQQKIYHLSVLIWNIYTYIEGYYLKCLPCKYSVYFYYVIFPRHTVFSESDSHFVPDLEALRDTLREPLPPKQSVMPPKWLMSSTAEPGSKGQPRTPLNHPTIQFSSPSAPSAAASKPVRSVSSVGASTQQSPIASTSTSQGTKQPPLPPPKPMNRSNAAMFGKSCWIVVAHMQPTVSGVHYECCSVSM